MTALTGLAPLPPGRDVPAAFPANPIPAPNTTAGREATRLYDELLAATRLIAEARDARTEATRRVEEARAELAAEVERGGREGQDVDHEMELVRELQARQLHADPSVHDVRQRAALVEQQAAEYQWRQYVTTHLAELLAELEPEADKTAAKLVAERAKVTPLEQAYAAVHERIRTLVNLAHPGDSAWDLALLPASPLPARELWADDEDREVADGRE